MQISIICAWAYKNWPSEHKTLPILFVLLYHNFITIYTNYNRGGCEGPAGMVLAGPLFEFLTLLLAINHYKSTNWLPSKKLKRQQFSNNYSIHWSPYLLLLTPITWWYWTSHIFLFQVSVQQIQVGSAFISG